MAAFCMCTLRLSFYIDKNQEKHDYNKEIGIEGFIQASISSCILIYNCNNLQETYKKQNNTSLKNYNERTTRIFT